MINRIKEHEFLYYIGKLFTRSSDSWFREKVLEIDKRNNSVVLNNLGSENCGVPIYVIEYSKEKSGFFAVLNHFCRYYDFADKFGLSPVCKINGNWLFSSGKNLNPFQDYFEQPTDISLDSALKSCCVIYSDYKHVGGEIYDYNDDYIVRMSEIVKKYVRFTSDILEKVALDWNSLEIRGKVLGVHVRGSDFKKNFNKHPTAIGVEEYIEAIKKILPQYDALFLATDDACYLQRFKEEDSFQEKLFYYADCCRSESDVSPSFMDNDRENHQYNLAYEVIRDMLSLSNCTGFIGGKSFVSMFARIFNASYGKSFDNCMILDKGLNQNGNQIDAYEKK